LRALVDWYQTRLTQLITNHRGACSSGEASPNDATEIHDATPDNGVADTKIFSCPKCQANFGRRRNNLERHWQTHVGCKERCLFCGYQMANVQQYSRHFEKCKKKSAHEVPPHITVEAHRRLVDLQADAKKEFTAFTTQKRIVKKRQLLGQHTIDAGERTQTHKPPTESQPGALQTKCVPEPSLTQPR
jgi:hypothetical protein